MYRVVDYVKRPEFRKWEGAIVEDVATGKRYITNGFFLWEATKSKLAKLKIVDNIDINAFMVRWNSKFFRGNIELKGV